MEGLSELVSIFKPEDFNIKGVWSSLWLLDPRFTSVYSASFFLSFFKMGFAPDPSTSKTFSSITSPSSGTQSLDLTIIHNAPARLAFCKSLAWLAFCRLFIVSLSTCSHFSLLNLFRIVAYPTKIAHSPRYAPKLGNSKDARAFVKYDSQPSPGRTTVVRA